MLSERMSFAGTTSIIGHRFSTLGSMISSMNDNKSNTVSEFEDNSIIQDYTSVHNFNNENRDTFKDN